MQREELVAKWKDNINNLNIEGLQLLETLFSGVAECERYHVDTSQERIEELKALEAQREEERKAQREEERRRREAEKPNPYTLNNTMRLLGHQCILGHMDKFRDMYNDVMQAHPYEGTFDICIDMFSLGIICGKRMDREKKRGLASAKA